MSKLCFILLVLLQALSIEAWGRSSNNNDRVLLEKVTAITLEDGKQTNARRTSPIPQLDCVGGSAGCYGYRPKIVQCRNAGFDGYEVQWECKAEMDSKYRFGRIEVSCEGYDYPDDPYVLRGSCGLKYELDLTHEGHKAKSNNFHNSYNPSGHPNVNISSGTISWIGSIIQLLVVGAIIYCCLGACLGSRGRRSHSEGYPSSSYPSSSYPTHPPPPYSSSYHSPPPPYPSAGGSSGPGFWSGAAAGGMLGYLFGNRNTGRSYYNSGWGGNRWGGSGWSSGGGWGSNNSGWGSGNSGWGSGSSGGSSGSSSSSRTTSGFGGTSRR